MKENKMNKIKNAIERLIVLGALGTMVAVPLSVVQNVYGAPTPSQVVLDAGEVKESEEDAKITTSVAKHFAIVDGKTIAFHSDKEAVNFYDDLFGKDKNFLRHNKNIAYSAVTFNPDGTYALHYHESTGMNMPYTTIEKTINSKGELKGQINRSTSTQKKVKTEVESRRGEALKTHTEYNKLKIEASKADATALPDIQNRAKALISHSAFHKDIDADLAFANEVQGRVKIQGTQASVGKSASPDRLAMYRELKSSDAIADIRTIKDAMPQGVTATHFIVDKNKHNVQTVQGVDTSNNVQTISGTNLDTIRKNAAAASLAAAFSSTGGTPPVTGSPTASITPLNNPSSSSAAPSSAASSASRVQTIQPSNAASQSGPASWNSAVQNAQPNPWGVSGQPSTNQTQPSVQVPAPSPSPTPTAQTSSNFWSNLNPFNWLSSSSSSTSSSASQSGPASWNSAVQNAQPNPWGVSGQPSTNQTQLSTPLVSMPLPNPMLIRITPTTPPPVTTTTTPPPSITTTTTPPPVSSTSSPAASSSATPSSPPTVSSSSSSPSATQSSSSSPPPAPQLTDSTQVHQGDPANPGKFKFVDFKDLNQDLKTALLEAFNKDPSANLYVYPDEAVSGKMRVKLQMPGSSTSSSSTSSGAASSSSPLSATQSSSSSPSSAASSSPSSSTSSSSSPSVWSLLWNQVNPFAQTIPSSSGGGSPTTTPPGGGSPTTTPPGGGSPTTTPPGGGSPTTTPPGGGSPTTTPPGGGSPTTTPPGGGSPTTTPPGGGSPTTTPPPPPPSISGPVIRSITPKSAAVKAKPKSEGFLGKLSQLFSSKKAPEVPVQAPKRVTKKLESSAKSSLTKEDTKAQGSSKRSYKQKSESSDEHFDEE